ncbi:adenylate cyclase 1 [Methylocaldum marinum]|uniref:Adenylate cyclase 1 n=1 Tax=Methylocaldum marinum TaxID=1432792 RepID=A0A250KNG4_9GAMM|nr:adenylate cyclase 1 [Methylocaldum marinum]
MRVGNVGSAKHYEFHAFGDIVNTTTRIERLNKALGTHILELFQMLNNCKSIDFVVPKPGGK